MSSDQIAPVFLPAVKHLEQVLSGLRAARATTGIVDHLNVTAYGATMRLKELATISVPDAKTILIEPWDSAQAPAIVKALQTSPLGLQPSETGSVIRLSLPPLTEERRRELAKVVRERLEEARVAIRQTREKLAKDLKSRNERGELSEDALVREQKRLQEEVRVATTAAEARGREKEEEILHG